MDWGCVVDSF